MIGTTLSHFKITAKLGEGGMGEVYRAEDTKLGREVAIKVLPEAVASDPERLARFEREAKVLASLNHPHIAAIYSFESADRTDSIVAAPLEGAREGTSPSPTFDESNVSQQSPGPRTQASGPSIHFLVMELAEGETLKEVIDRAPVDERDALPIALQIAEAMEAAHDQGIVHRDLKPANVVVDGNGQVKVLDFGLAKAFEGDSSSAVASALSMSPTLTAQMTGAGVILGTAAYMSPEQARGKPVDRRSDVWAFGCVLFEMLTGSSTYSGETVTDILGAIVHKDPDWSELPAGIAPPVRELLERCLDKDPRRRLQAIGEGRLLLERYLADPEAFAAPAAPTMAAPGTPLWKRALPWLFAGLLAVALGAALLRPEGDTAVLRATIPPPDGQVFHLDPFDPGPAVLSPDGSRLAFSARDAENRVLLHVRPLDAVQAFALTGTEDAQYPFWSPDGRWIGFFTKNDETLKKINATGGPPMSLCSASDGKGGTWSEEGVIVFAPDADTPLHRVSAAGGESTPVTEIDEARFDSHRHPRFLPDGEHFLYLARGADTEGSRLMIGSLDGDVEARELLSSQSQGEVAEGRLFFIRERTLMVQPFDEKRLELSGEAAPIAEHVIEMPGTAVAVFSVSRAGVLAYQTGETTMGVSLKWVDRQGQEVGSMGEIDSYRTAVISPDGRYALTTIVDQETGAHDLWLYEIQRDLATRFTFGDADEWFAAWSPGSQSVIYTSDSEGKTRFFRKDISGSAEPELVLERDNGIATSVSPDGRYLAFSTEGEATQSDLWILPLDGGGEPEFFRQSEFQEFFPVFSPDGQWLAYFSDESGQFEIYVEPYPGPGRRWRVSTESGVYPYWSDDGSEILYHQFNGEVMSAAIEQQGEGLQIDQPRALFQIANPSAGGAIFAPTPDAQSFLIVPSSSQEADTLLNLVVNWPRALSEQ
jgi:serine/threonine protein kinase/Tol biopolymer transport system component